MDTADDTTQRLADNPMGGDEKLSVRFLLLDVENAEKSREAGYPVYDQVEGIQIRAPGNRDEVLRKAMPRDKARFGRHYAAFKSGMQEPTTGLPLREWPVMSKGDVEVFIFQHGIRTVEQLAAVSDSNLNGLGHGGVRMRQKAREWIERAKVNAPTDKFNAQLAERDNKIEVLMRAVETLQKQAGVTVAPLVEAPVASASLKRKRTRAPKESTP